MDEEYEVKNLDELLILDIKKRVGRYLFDDQLDNDDKKILELDKQSLEMFKENEDDYYYSKVLVGNLISKIDYILDRK